MRIDLEFFLFTRLVLAEHKEMHATPSAIAVMKAVVVIVALLVSVDGS
jgi:hypothetical protein